MKSILSSQATGYYTLSAEIKWSPTRPERLDTLMQYLGSGILVAHNAAFDLHFLNRLMREHHGFTLQNLVIDTPFYFPLLARYSFPLTVH